MLLTRAPISAQISTPPARNAEKLVVAASTLSTSTVVPIKSLTFSALTTLAEVLSVLTPALTPIVVAAEVEDMDLAEKQAMAKQAIAELFAAQQIADDEALGWELTEELATKDEAT